MSRTRDHRTVNHSSRKPLLRAPDEVKSAAAAGLRYSIPKGLGIRRRRVGKGFVYIDAGNRPIRDENTLRRIRSLVIPPAWASVWINPDPNGHIQVVGRDARGRKQYRYHSKYRAIRDLVKFDRMTAFGKVLPRIRTSVTRDLKSSGLPKEKILAAVVRLLEITFIRVGNEEYAEENGSFGLTTLRNKHLEIIGDLLRFRFPGKSAQKHDIKLRDAHLARILRKCKDLPGSALFEYLEEDGTVRTVDSGDVNEYLRQISGDDFTAKDFRTWGGTCLAVGLLLKECNGHNRKATKKLLVEMVKGVADRLGNRPATCRKYYIHPAIIDCYNSGILQSVANKCRDNRGRYRFERMILSLLNSGRAPHISAA